jgi:hypothetical protein
MNFLVDHNLRGHSLVLAGVLAASGWLDLISIRFILFEEVGSRAMIALFGGMPKPIR